MIKQFATLLIVAVATLGMAGVATAQGDGSADTSSNVRELVQTLRQKAAELQSIHTETLKANPDLRQQQEQFVALLRNAIEDHGYDIEAGRKHVKNMMEKLQSGQLTDDERQTVMQGMAAERRSLAKARTAALQEPEVQSAGTALQQATLAAMAKQDPRSKQLIADMKNIRRQLQAAAPDAPAN